MAQASRRTTRRPPPRPGSVAAAELASPETAEVTDDSDESAETTEPAETTAAETATTDNDPKPKSGRGNSKHAGLPAHLRKAAVLRTLADRIGVTIHGRPGTKSVEMDGWVNDDDIVRAKEAANAAVQSLELAATTLEGKGADFTPSLKRTRSAAATQPVAGARYRLTEAERSNDKKGYDDLMSAADMDNLVFVRKAGTRLVFKAPGGGKMFFRRNQVEVYTEAAEAS